MGNTKGFNHNDKIIITDPTPFVKVSVNQVGRIIEKIDRDPQQLNHSYINVYNYAIKKGDRTIIEFFDDSFDSHFLQVLPRGTEYLYLMKQ